MRILYSIILYLGTPLILLHFAIRGAKDRGYLKGWKERFAIARTDGESGGIVVHAASVGEVNAAAPLISFLLKDTKPVTVSTFTPTGSRRARELFGDRTEHVFAPLDLPGAVKRFFKNFDPALLIIMETEIWPNLFHTAHQKGIPILMANARISSKSLKGYSRLRSLTHQALRCVDHAATQSQQDAVRLVACGLEASRVHVSGNLKFEASVPDGLGPGAAELREQWGAGRPVIIAASTHEDDDTAVLNAFPEVLEVLPDCLLIVVPRHPERFTATARQAAGAGLRTEKFSNGRACSTRAQCFVIDAMGELMTYFACSDLAIIGGSFGSVGGHNALEASALGLPVIVGPDMENFSEITDALIDAGAAVRVSDAQDLSTRVLSLLQSREKRKAMGTAGFSLVENGKGALEHTLGMVEKLLTVVRP